MDPFLILSIMAIAVFLFTFFILFQILKSTQKSAKSQKKPEYDSEGYNSQGYNEVGRNRQGKYNRYYNTKCYETNLYSEEGFLDIRENPLFLTNHARERMNERLGIQEYCEMDNLAFEAYQFGKSKLQIMKSETGYIEEKEKEYQNSVILIYHGYCYVFTDNNGLITVYKNDKIVS